MEEKEVKKEQKEFSIPAGLLIFGAIYTVGYIVGKAANNGLDAAYNKGVVDTLNFMTSRSR